MTLTESRILRAAINLVTKPAGMGWRQELDRAVRELMRERRAKRMRKRAA